MGHFHWWKFYKIYNVHFEREGNPSRICPAMSSNKELSGMTFFDGAPGKSPFDLLRSEDDNVSLNGEEDNQNTKSSTLKASISKKSDPIPIRPSVIHEMDDGEGGEWQQSSSHHHHRKGQNKQIVKSIDSSHSYGSSGSYGHHGHGGKGDGATFVAATTSSSPSHFSSGATGNSNANGSNSIGESRSNINLGNNRKVNHSSNAGNSTNSNNLGSNNSSSFNHNSSLSFNRNQHQNSHNVTSPTNPISQKRYHHNPVQPHELKSETTLELYNFPTEYRTNDLRKFLTSFDGHYRLKWKDDHCCWAVFDGSDLSEKALLELQDPVIKLKRYTIEVAE